VPDQSQHDRHGVTHQQVPFITNVCVDIIGELGTFGICYHYTSPRFVIQRDMFKPTKHFYAQELSSLWLHCTSFFAPPGSYFPKQVHQFQPTFTTIVPPELSRPWPLGAVSATSKHPATAYLPSFEGRQTIQAKASMVYARWTATSFHARGSTLCLSSCRLAHNSVCSDCCHNIRYRLRSQFLDASQQPQECRMGMSGMNEAK
jgi:hypothetical protein